jgi:urease accessory protein
VRIQRQDPPWKVVRAFPQESGILLVHLHNVSGGVLAGDRLQLRIDVAAGAAAQITTTGATRLYRHRAGAEDSEQRVQITVGEDALFEYLPDPVIPYAGSRHVQFTEIRMAPRSALFWWEILAPGRQAAGEQFAFERLRIDNHVVTGTRSALRENFVLDPARRPLTAAARMHEYTWTASLCICQEGRTAATWRALEDELNALAAQRTRQGQSIWGASTLAWDGVVVRGLATSGRFLQPTLTEFWRVARRSVTGEEAVPPRKLH